ILLTAVSCFTQNISTGLAIAGVIVIMTKFTAACEIPARFIERNVSLRGKVHSITERGLEVEHVPIYLPVLSPLLSKHKDASPSLLLVHLAGVELTPEGRVWLQQKLPPAQTVWLKLLSREDDVLHCLVYCLNDEVLRLGLARTAPVTGVLPGSRLYWRLHKRLHKAEVKAERKGRGLWKEDSLWERTSKAIRDSWWVLTHTVKLLGPSLPETKPLGLLLIYMSAMGVRCLKDCSATAGTSH
uniref:TNase-like domain-containing protein n=1 Tax=Stegastes partitus TaxID=144197 RepID=A0A3B4ZDY0_9TELE